MPIVKKNTSIEIANGDGGFRICNKILQNKNIRSRKFVCVAIKAYSIFNNNYYPGYYIIEKNYTLSQLIKRFKTVVIDKIVIPEGLTVYEIKQILEENKCWVGEFPDNVKEGSLMPETYMFSCGSTKAKIVEKMQSDMSKFIEQEWRKRDINIPLHNIEDVVTMASIIEKECSDVQERKIVSSVFMNRLKKRMRLESCATLIYAITGGKGQSKFKRILRYKDLYRETPYNTYRKEGLPPTPIANPGKESIIAALHPMDTKYLFFVKKEHGLHSFSENFNQHVRFKNKKNIEQ